ncbi:MAG: hypothetical protein H6581_20320 [Bacteroidia bacterium]|nr:hypothetical protein [Bacteroidia bacterium]
MMQRKGILLLLALVLGFSVSGWSQAGVHKNMVQVQGTFGVGNNFHEWKYYVYGDLGFMASDHIEINGVIFANLGSSANDLTGVAEYISPNLFGQDYRTHSLFFGPRYHFMPNQPFDVYALVQPGVTLVHTQTVQSVGGFAAEPARNGLAPVFSVGGGLAYYGSFFHLFGETRFVAGGYYNEAYSIPLNEIRLAFGLGFNFN